MSLDRFKTAQADKSSGFETALAELRGGRKTSHWIWYIFPQLASLGRSSTARFYGLSGLDEAGDYLCDPLLRQRLLLAVQAVDRQLVEGALLRKLMGSEIDCFKLVSSLTLFQLATEKLRATALDAGMPESQALLASCTRVLNAASGQGFPRCGQTLQEVASPDRS